MRAFLIPDRRPQRGFTLVELLVVIAIIGVLVALLLPAVQAAREAARRASCLNNVAQLGLALHNYEFHFEALPPGVSDTAGPIRQEPQGKHISWVVAILPYLEQNTLARLFDHEAGAYGAANAIVRKTEIRTLQCPSDPAQFTNETHTVARSSYAGCHHDREAPIDKDNYGLLFLNSRVRYAEIYDGSSMTILLGEAINRPEGLGWVSGTRATLRNTSSIEAGGPYLPQSPSATLPEEQRPGSLFVGGFGSNHLGGSNFAFADGSTRFIPHNIDKTTLQRLGNRADGEIMNPF